MLCHGRVGHGSLEVPDCLSKKRDSLELRGYVD